MVRGGLLGFLLGLMPGPAAVVASFASYGLERRISRRPGEFGRGAIEGVAGPAAANNSATAGGLVPLLALGLPFAPPTAVLLGGLMMQGVMPGPLLMQQHPEVFWGVIGSMYVGNLILLVLNLPLVGVFASITKVSPSIVMPVILLLTVVGAYAVNNSLFDVVVMFVAGVTGYVMRKYDFEPAPLVLGLVLGAIMELLHLAEGLGLRCVLGHGFGLTLNTLAELHVAMANANVLLPGEMVGVLKTRDDIVEPRIAIQGDRFHVGDRAGLGADLLPEKLRQYQR